MKELAEAKYYSPLEEKINVSTHAFGLLLSIIALVFLLMRASMYGNTRSIVSFAVFGLSLVFLYAVSTLYHSAKKPESRIRLRIYDHASIYVLIAGTYTPFTLITLNGTTGWVIFGISWGLAISGIILKMFFTGKYHLLSTLMYIFMGWVIVFAINPLIENLSSQGLLWLLAGGVAYTVGAALYSVRTIKFNHAIFHIFVLIGSFSHFMSVYFYVLPIE